MHQKFNYPDEAYPLMNTTKTVRRTYEDCYANTLLDFNMDLFFDLGNDILRLIEDPRGTSPFLLM